jgi:histidine ammonia-lyase
MNITIKIMNIRAKLLNPLFALLNSSNVYPLIVPRVSLQASGGLAKPAQIALKTVIGLILPL